MAINTESTKTLSVILTGKKSNDYKLTANRVNELLGNLNIPYEISSHFDKDKKMRSYELKNLNQGVSLSYPTMWEIIDTLKPTIEKRSEKLLQTTTSFFDDLIAKAENVKAMVETGKRPGRKRGRKPKSGIASAANA